MSVIVERLRQEPNECGEEAADEIERLRADLREEVEITSLTARLAQNLLEERDAARIDAARLRAALALIATPPRPDGTWNRDRQACYELAREALEGTP